MTSSATAGAEARSNDVRKLDRRPWAVRVREQCAALKLHPTTRLVALTVATYFDEHGSWAMPIVEIERATGLKRAAVFKHLAILIGKGVGVLDVVRGGGALRNHYKIGTILREGGPPAKRTSQSTTVAPPVHGGGPDQSTTVDQPVHGGGPVRTHKTPTTTPEVPARNPELVSCPRCGKSWQARYGTKCFTCGDTRNRRGKGILPPAGKYDNL